MLYGPLASKSTLVDIEHLPKVRKTVIPITSLILQGQTRIVHWRRKWQPTPVFLPGESQERGSLVAAIYGVTQSRTRAGAVSPVTDLLLPEAAVDDAAAQVVQPLSLHDVVQD